MLSHWADSAWLIPGFFEDMHIFGFFLVMVGCCYGQAAEFFALEDGAHHQWCAYSAKSAWNAEVDALESLSVASIRFSDGHVSAVDFTKTDETGDWIIYDRYTFDRSGRLLTLERRTNLATVDRGILETFVLGDGKVVRTATSQVSLRSGARLPFQKVWAPSLTVRMSVREFPFARLFEAGIEGMKLKEKVCIAVP